MKVVIQYFKPSGKYYAEGTYETNQTQLFQIWDELRAMFAKHDRPGLMRGPQYYIALVNVPGHIHEHPCLIIPN